MIIARFTDEDALAAALASRLIDAVRTRPRLVLGLPTGRTPLALYRTLADRSRHDGIDWSGVRTFNLDEFAGLGGADAGSYRAFMQSALFDHLGIAAAHIGMLDGRATDLAAECARYERAIAAAGGIDIQVLGIGANGHIGFNEPAAALHAQTHIATLQRGTRDANAQLFGNDPDRVPGRALSMGMATILGAREIVLVATGEEKAAAVDGMVNGLVTTQLPASFLQLHPRVTVMIDQAAGGADP
ncbi:MAG: glucosamine-6-phosphate deaminase [Vicinamibacterales bacterium]